jgi:hypothetical protein
MKRKPKLKRFVRVKWSTKPGEPFKMFIQHSDFPNNGFRTAPKSCYQIEQNTGLYRGLSLRDVHLKKLPETWEIILAK